MHVLCFREPFLDYKPTLLKRDLEFLKLIP
jgi:hypothetical protein